MFQPVAQFGLLMSLMLVAALISTMVLLPALVATRLGSLLMKRMGTNTEPSAIGR